MRDLYFFVNLLPLQFCLLCITDSINVLSLSEAVRWIFYELFRRLNHWEAYGDLNINENILT